MNMKRTAGKLALAATVVLAFCGSDWTQFRGNDNRGVSEETGLPVAFDPGSKMARLPGRGPSSPIVVGDRVIVTTSSGAKSDRLHVRCYSDKQGNLLWERRLWATGHTICHPFGDVATPTPASNGKLVVAFFSSNDLACFDLEGNLKWFRGLARDYPTARNDVGMSSSPLIVGDTVIVQVENQGESFAAGIDLANGQTRWRIPRDKDAIWSSPVVLRGGKTAEGDLVLLQSRSKLTAHHPETGKQAWQFEASCHTIASATTDKEGHVYLPANGLHKLKCDAKGGVELLWHQPRLRSGNASPIVHEGRAYTIKKPGILVCGNAQDGKVLWQLRMQGPFWATPVLADGKLYCVNHRGLVQVVELAEEGKLLGTSQLGEGVLASPAVANGAIYFRNDQRLWRIDMSQATEPQAATPKPQ
jgi:outer membrane protein assembly factor BamB